MWSCTLASISLGGSRRRLTWGMALERFRHYPAAAGSMRDKLGPIGRAVDGWARQHWRADGGLVARWSAALLFGVVILAWGMTNVGLPQNPSSAVAPLATQIA